MKAPALFTLLLAVGCIRQAAPAEPASAPRVQPESTPTAHAEAAPAAPAAPAAQAARLGAPLTVATPTALATIVATPDRFSGQTVRVEGTVTAVCQAAGCWMQLTDADQHVHVKMHGHSFFIPRNASGRHARVQGTVISGNPNGHCEQEAAAATGQPVARLELDATGVELD